MPMTSSEISIRSIIHWRRQLKPDEISTRSQATVGMQLQRGLDLDDVRELTGQTELDNKFLSFEPAMEKAQHCFGMGHSKSHSVIDSVQYLLV